MIDLRLDRIGKKYNLRASGNSTKRWYRNAFARRSSEMWALRNISFEVKEGEALGIVGHNGAGKTTILKLLSSITTPSCGEIMIRGRLAALVEIGSGFHPELSGRENVYLHGAMLGMRRSEIARKMERIVEFSGVESYIDVPVKRYSSGMYVRLGFAIVAHLDADILLLDEVLAVGDVAFQAKCLERIAELRKNGSTIVFVSHDLAAVYHVCDRALLLDAGEVRLDGAPRSVIDQYQKMTFASSTLSFGEHDPEKLAECVGVSFISPDASDCVRTGYPMLARLSYRAMVPISDVVFRISLYWPSGYLCTQFSNEALGPGLSLEPGEGAIEFQCPVLPVVPGFYRIDLEIASKGRELDARQRCATLCVEPGKAVSGDFYIESTWSIRNEAPIVP
jgi:ABC-type polysaccharide/polyol phosphate transport system ATPase subunit